jgi:hypothetical protein
MKAILLFFLFFFLTLTFTSFKKAHFLKNFTELLKGKVKEVISTDEGVFLVVHYSIGEQTHIYKHRFSSVKLPEKKLEFLINKYLDSNFYLLAKKENDTLTEVTAYANVKIVKWLYLLGSLAIGYLLLA